MIELRAGVVGLGVMGRNHARVLSSLDGVKFVGACDPFTVSREHPFEVYRELGHLIEQGMDYCVVAVPTSEHLNVGLELANARVATLIEKPIAIDLISAENLRLAFQRNGILAGVGHIERYNPAAQEARRRIEMGQLGEIIQIATSRQSPFPGRLQDVGVSLDLATHDIDLTAWLTSSDYSLVTAHSRRLSGHKHEDLLSVIAKLTNGVVANHIINWLSPRKERRVSITGERGMFQIDTLTSDLTFFENGSVPHEWGQVAQFRGISQGDVIQYAFPKREPLVLEHEAFRDALMGAQSEIVSLESATMTLKVALAALESSEADTAIHL